MTEPGIGSDLASMTTSAIRDNGHYVVNGAKTFITNGIHADLVITAVKTDPSQKHRGMSLLILERGMDGFERGRNLEKVGMHSQDTAELFFQDVAVPVENRLGDEGQGFTYLVSNLPQERLSIAVSAVASAQAALDWTVEYVKERQAFGQAIASFQNTRFALAEMKTEIELATAYCDKAVVALNAGELTPGGGRDGEVVDDGAPGPRRRPLRAAPRRLRLHARVPDRARLRRRADHAHLRRHDRDHEGDHRPLDGPVRRSAGAPARWRYRAAPLHMSEAEKVTA